MLYRKNSDKTTILLHTIVNYFINYRKYSDNLHKKLQLLTDFDENVKFFSEEPLTRQLLMNLLKDYKRPYDKIHELTKSGELVQIKRGFYIPGPKLSIEKPSSYLLANHLWGPSYVSAETALSFWGMIPERVFETCSVTIKNARLFDTPAGRFSYIHADTPYYAFGITRVELTKKQSALMATREKALCDKIVTTSGIFLRSIRQTKDFLLEDLRIDKDDLKELNLSAIRSWLPEAPKSGSLEMLVKTIESI